MLSATSSRCRPRPAIRPEAGLRGGERCEGGLLAVVFQHLIAGRRDLGAVLLQAGQNGEIALIDHRAAEALNVARAGLLLFRRAAALLLGEGVRSKPMIDNRASARRNLRIVFLHSRQQEIRFPNRAWHAGTDLSGWQAPRIAATSRAQALANAAKFAAADRTAASINRLIIITVDISCNCISSQLAVAGRALQQLHAADEARRMIFDFADAKMSPAH